MEYEKRKLNINRESLMASKLIYTPDTDQIVHEEGAIRLICAPFQSHENGLPEWVKNSADAYAREDVPESKRVIVLIFDLGGKTNVPSISCLDFVGMTSNDIEQYFRCWADPTAAAAGKKGILVQGGHGNGGKCYMTQMFKEYSQLYTVRFYKGCKYGVPGGSVKFGYIPDTLLGKDFQVVNLKSEMNKALSDLKCTTALLPRDALSALDSATGFSIITGFGPKGYEKKFPIGQLLKDLKEHPQMLRSIEGCRVFIIVNGKPENYGKPMGLPVIKPMSGGENPRIYEIPSKLIDPVSCGQVSTTDEGKFHRGKLIFNTSEKSMRYGTKARHTVRFRSDLLGDFGYVPISELEVQSAYRDHIYGTCHLESLEQFKQNMRARLAESPLTRAVEQFIGDKIQEYAKEFEARDKRKYDKEEKDAISKMNEALDKWKNRFLKETMQGLWGPGTGTPPPSPSTLQKGIPAKIELVLSHQKAGLGVTFRPTLKFYNSEGKPITAVPSRLVSEDNNIAMADDKLGISTFRFGQIFIYAETVDSGIQSKKVPLEVVNIKEIKIFPERIEIEAGSRQKFEASCKLSKNEITNDVYLIWVEDDKKIASVSSAGLVFAFSPGETGVFAGDNNCQASQPAIVKVLQSQGRGKGDKRGQGFPLVLISGFDCDPETGADVEWSSDDPPIAQRPEDSTRNIWWINSSAPLAKLYLDTSKGYGFKSREWRAYHLERYIDVIIQIIVENTYEEELLSVDDWIREWGAKASWIQTAACSDLSEFIASGELPSND